MPWILIPEFLLGAFCVLLVLYDVFQSVVVPRWTGRTLRLAPYFVDAMWPRWRRFALRRLNGQMREDFLGNFASFALMGILLMWGIVLIFGYGLMLHAAGDGIKPPLHDYGSAFYVAGTSLLTIGFGDIVGVSALSRTLLLLAGASGLAVVALVISLTFTLYDAFKLRETLVLTLDARAGTPPSGVTLLETYAQFDLLDELTATFGVWEIWSSQVLETHLAYPLLPFFRSSHDGESWVSAMGAVLDAATLVLTTVEVGRDETGNEYSIRSCGPAHMMYGLGCHAVTDLSQWFRFRVPTHPQDMTLREATEDAGVERGEWLAARRRLAKVGYSLREEEESWRDFVKHRAVYAQALNALARHFASPPTQWIGDRSSITHLHHRAEN